MALNFAELGNVTKAQAYLEQIISTPSIRESQWIEPAELFLSHYQSAQDVYQACTITNSKCDLGLAIARVASTIERHEFGNALQKFEEAGVPVVANGRFNFYRDFSPQQWFIVQHQPSGDLEFWILSTSDTRVKAMFVDVVDNLNPDLLLYIPSRELYPVDNSIFQFTIGNGAVYNFIRRQRDQEPYITKQTEFEPYIIERDPLNASLDQIIDDLLNSTNPEEILVRMQNWAEDPDSRKNNRYYYYLGLTYELLQDEENAVATYLMAWGDCCDFWVSNETEIVTANPYAIMARTKLEPVP